LTHDDRRPSRDVRYRPTGMGMATPNFHCMGCKKPRQTLGARGAGIKKRCAGCLAKLQLAQGDCV
jgi:hypothetical protein